MADHPALKAEKIKSTIEFDPSRIHPEEILRRHEADPGEPAMGT